MNSFFNQFLVLFFGICVISSTMLNIAFTYAPQTMTHWLLSLTS